MLVLTRKLNEEIQIGPNVKITILRVKGQSVRVGIEAPKNMNIVRSELIGRAKPAADSLSAAPANGGACSAAEPAIPEAASEGESEAESLNGRRILRLSRCRAAGARIDSADWQPERSSPASHVLLPPGTPLGRRAAMATATPDRVCGPVV